MIKAILNEVKKMGALKINVYAFSHAAIRTDRTRGGRSNYEGCSPAPRSTVVRTQNIPAPKPPPRKKIIIPPPQATQGPDTQDGSEQVSKEYISIHLH